jgi:hypothetical protein
MNHLLSCFFCSTIQTPRFQKVESADDSTLNQFLKLAYLQTKSRETKEYFIKLLTKHAIALNFLFLFKWIRRHKAWAGTYIQQPIKKWKPISNCAE